MFLFKKKKVSITSKPIHVHMLMDKRRLLSNCFVWLSNCAVVVWGICRFLFFYRLSLEGSWLSIHPYWISSLSALFIMSILAEICPFNQAFIGFFFSLCVYIYIYIFIYQLIWQSDSELSVGQLDFVGIFICCFRFWSKQGILFFYCYNSWFTYLLLFNYTIDNNKIDEKY